MASLGLTRRRLVALFKAIADSAGAPDLKVVPPLGVAGARRDELGTILKECGHDFSFLLARIEADPDLSSLSRRRRVEALIDYTRLAIGLVDRALWPRRGRIIVSVKED